MFALLLQVWTLSATTHSPIAAAIPHREPAITMKSSNFAGVDFSCSQHHRRRCPVLVAVPTASPTSLFSLPSTPASILPPLQFLGRHRNQLTVIKAQAAPQSCCRVSNPGRARLFPAGSSSPRRRYTPLTPAIQNPKLPACRAVNSVPCHRRRSAQSHSDPSCF